MVPYVSARDSLATNSPRLSISRGTALQVYYRQIVSYNCCNAIADAIRERVRARIRFVGLRRVSRFTVLDRAQHLQPGVTSREHAVTLIEKNIDSREFLRQVVKIIEIIIASRFYNPPPSPPSYRVIYTKGEEGGSRRKVERGISTASSGLFLKTELFNM